MNPVQINSPPSLVANPLGEHPNLAWLTRSTFVTYLSELGSPRPSLARSTKSMANEDWDDALDDFDYGAINYDTLDDKINEALRNSSKAPKLIWSDGTMISRPPSVTDEELVVLLVYSLRPPESASSAKSIEFKLAGGSDLTDAIVEVLQCGRPVLVANAPFSRLAWGSQSCFQQLGIHPEVLVPVCSKWGKFIETAIGKYLDDTEIERGSTRRLAIPRWTMPGFMEFLDQGYLLGWSQPLHLDPRPTEVDSEHCWVQFFPKYTLSGTAYHPYGLLSDLASRDKLVQTFTRMGNFSARDLKDLEGCYSGSYSIILREGDVLVLPPTTFYQMYASEDTILTGNCFVHLRMLHLTEALRSFAHTCPEKHPSHLTIKVTVLYSLLTPTYDDPIVLPRKCIGALTSMVIHGLSYTLSDFNHPISSSLKAMGAKLRDQVSKPPPKKGLKMFLKTNVGDKPLPVTLIQSRNGEKLATFVSHQLQERLDIQVNIVYKVGKYSGGRDYLFEGGEVWMDAGYPVNLSSVITFREFIENDIICEL
ncbi:hypothetical protein NLJ89_g11250 [Agrocybe chaxingu]|uniref:JmjC domain-containing protein n=1 Tax=Agrocybe chaxingu TaxID=84603 RepID=A0A9W8JWM7_9AGAR|nr:hypothetical protein NLJ89_g11250 [Agrocybe chaxingu]